MPLGPIPWGTLQSALHLSDQTILLTTVVAYVVSAAAGGALGAVLGRRFLTTVGLSALALMIVGVLLDVLAPGAGIFAIGRVLSGLGAGAAVGATAALAWRTGRGRGAVVATLAALGVLSLVLGPFVNQGLTSAMTWRLGYLVVVLPLLAGLLAAAVSGFVLLLTRRPAQPNPAGPPYPQAAERPGNAPPGT
ncbi:MFS transporter [Nonomuraea jiangxiensis]|nr:MFS transporter [Nonomuraea jiangxiensis]